MTNRFNKLPLELGMDFMIELAGISRIKYQLVGGLTDEYLILKIPHQIAQGSMINFQPETQLVVRYLYKGQIYGFKSSIIVYSTVPDKLIYIRYPIQFAQHSIRNAARINCLLPAKLLYKDQQLAGTIIDISESGCSWRSSNMTNDRIDELNFPDQVQLSIHFPGISDPVSFSCKDKNANKESELVCLGFEFSGLSQIQVKALEIYIHLGLVDDRLFD